MNAEEAEKLVSEVALPAQADALLEHPRFWHAPVCLVLFDRSDEIGFEQPKAGLEVARCATLLVDKLPGRYRLGAEKTLLKSRSFVILGSRYRALARLRESNLSYRLAFGLSEGARPLDLADLFRRQVALRIDERRFEDAETLTSRYLEIAHEIGDEHQVGRGLLARGDLSLHRQDFEQAADDYAAAADLLDPAISSRAYYAAVHNLAAALAKSAATPEQIDRALAQIQEAKRIGYDLESLPGMILVWLEGILLAKADRSSDAEAAYRTAQAGLIELGASYETALLLLDFAELLCNQGRMGELVEIAAEMFPLFAHFRANREVITALRLFHHAAVNQEVTVDLIVKVRKTIEKADRRLD